MENLVSEKGTGPVSLAPSGNRIDSTCDHYRPRAKSYILGVRNASCSSLVRN